MKYVRPSYFCSRLVRREDDHPAREVREARPHLVAVEDPVVAFAHCGGLHAREIAAAFGSEKPWHQISSRRAAEEGIALLLSVP
jgi:hypothetical protein